MGVVFGKTDVAGFLGSWLLFSFLLAFILGTYERVDVQRSRRGHVTISKVWRFCFYSKPYAIEWRDYEGIVTGCSYSGDLWSWIAVLSLVPFGIIPGVLFWYYFIHRETFFVALCKDHGYPEMPLLRSPNEQRIKDVAGVVRQVTELPFWE
jgi:hypothetical protein